MATYLGLRQECNAQPETAPPPPAPSAFMVFSWREQFLTKDAAQAAALAGGA